MTGLIDGGRDIGRFQMMYEIDDNKRNIIGAQLSQDIRSGNIMIVFDNIDEIRDFVLNTAKFYNACLNDKIEYEREKADLNRMFGGNICD